MIIWRYKGLAALSQLSRFLHPSTCRSFLSKKMTRSQFQISSLLYQNVQFLGRRPLRYWKANYIHNASSFGKARIYGQSHFVPGQLPSKLATINGLPLSSTLLGRPNRKTSSHMNLALSAPISFFALCCFLNSNLHTLCNTHHCGYCGTKSDCDNILTRVR